MAKYRGALNLGSGMARHYSKPPQYRETSPGRRRASRPLRGKPGFDRPQRLYFVTVKRQARYPGGYYATFPRPQCSIVDRDFTAEGDTHMKIENIIRQGMLGFAAIGLLAIGASATSSPVFAQQSDIHQDRKDVRQDKRDIRADKRDRRSDQRDINKDKRQLARSNAKNGVDSKRSRALRHDIRSDRRDRNKDTRDIRHDRKDVRHDRRDIRHDRRGH